MTKPPVLLWLRRDLRLADHPALSAAAKAGPVIPIFIHDSEVEALGAAAKWRLGEGLRVFEAQLAARGLRLILRRGEAQAVLSALMAQTGAREVHWSRAYHPDAIRRDTAVKAMLRERALRAESHPGHILFEPWTVATKEGGFYRVYSPFWRAVRGRDPGVLLPVPQITPPEVWPESDSLEDWHMGAALNRGARVLAKYGDPGEAAAARRLARFLGHGIARYKADRDRPALDATSGLSEYLTYGEISPRQVWWAGARALEAGGAGAEHFLKELVWREFAYHLMYHTPALLTRNWRSDWAAFPWRTDGGAGLRAWQRGATGVGFVDAAMREMYVTGRMHNRARMVTASFLTKHLLTHWKIGMDWFADHLTDWDPAANAMGWQWVAGSGPDAAPYFRIFNPETQAKTHDPDGTYRRRWIAEGQVAPPTTARDFFDAVPHAWGLSATRTYPHAPIVDLAAGRAAALAAYATLRQQGEFKKSLPSGPKSAHLTKRTGNTA